MCPKPKSTEEDDRQCKYGIEKTVHIPASLTPGQIVNRASATYTQYITPPFHAGIFAVNKHDVECLASGLRQGITFSYRFGFAKWDGDTTVNTMRVHGYDHTELLDHWEMTDGHHRFLA